MDILNKNDIMGKNALIIGMARSGIAAAEQLLSLGARVVLNDAKDAEALGVPEDLLQKCECRFGCRADGLLNGVDFIVVSPSVKPSIPALVTARGMGIPVYTEIELGYRLCAGTTYCITGTNGKTTTTTLTGEIFKDAGRDTRVVGNIGLPYISEALTAGSDTAMITEISSYQLECIIKLHPHISALLNITPDHIDRHGSFENYIAVKKRVFENQTSSDFAVLNYDDELVRKAANGIKSKVFFFSRKIEPENGAFVRDGVIVFRLGAVEQPVCRTDELLIKGGHNIENALAAVAIAMLAGISARSAAYTLKRFRGVEHRIEPVDTVNGVEFINDSKGTNPDSTIKAIQAMDKPTVLLLGGYDKGGEFDELIGAYTPFIKQTVVLGATAEKIKASMKKYDVPYTEAVSFRDAVEKAYTLAQDGWCVLLSPACASWDMFSDYEERGRVFKQIVGEIKNKF